jgi:rod shape determining protein RodA
MAVDRRVLYHVDWALLGAAAILLGIGVAMIASATHTGRFSGLHIKQLWAIALGLTGLVLACAADYHRLTDRAGALFLLALLALVTVLAVGPRIAGTKRWFVLGPFGQIQPSELAKLAAALFLARAFSESRRETLGLGDVLAPGAAVGAMALLIAAEPDLGTAACLVPLFVAVSFTAGLRLRAIAGLVVVLAVVGGLGWTFALKDYQKSRVYTFLDPRLDPRGAGYQKIQSQIAVGSGGLLGKGYRQGGQSQLGYLPARQTDFIFSVLAEEFGFLGVAVVLGLYLFVLWRIFETARLARDRPGILLTVGLGAVLAFQVVYNVAMVAGLAPVKGLPLPLLSYGGSSVLSTMMALGLVLNVRMRRFAN